MPVINRKEGWLFLDEPHTGSIACTHALLKVPGSELIGKQHEPWPSLNLVTAVGVVETFSVVRHPLEIIATLATKSESFPYWLIRKYRHRDPFFIHRCHTTLQYNRGLQYVVEKHVGRKLDFNHTNVTPNKFRWEDEMGQGDFMFACATIPELFTLGYINWEIKGTLIRSDIETYLQKHGDQKVH